jgi:signal transduction histidine kinase
VLEAVDCEKALNVTKTESIDVLVTDVVMPSMSGVELALAIRTQQPSTPVLFCTGQIANFIPPLENSAVIKKPLLIFELQSQLASLVRDTEWNGLLMAWPELGKVYDALAVCKKILKQLKLGGDGGNLVEVALQHKARDSVNMFCDELASGAGVEVSAERLRIQLSKLSALVRAVRNGERLGLPGYLLGSQADLHATYRNLRLNIDMDESVRNDLPREIEAPLTLCAVELIDNAREALGGKGEIRVAVRKWITTEAVSISVASDTGPLIDDVAAHLFEEGFSTRGSDRGLGLSLVKQFAQRLGGDVELVCDLASVEFILTVPTNVVAEHSTNTIRRMRPGQ